ncbi:MAG TPA: exonuclease domain-containing protein, partial [Bradyrhizobium sp.]|nr:exonuclease domain-containing protein [Bradyrhizobium sp.]
ILQFGAVRADDELRELERFDVRCRLMPHVVPSPQAMIVTGQRIEDLTDPSRPSHYHMISEIRARLLAWSPALFAGWNSMRFDEEFLRQGFFQTLHPPYITNTAGNRRADILDIARAVAALRPETINVPRTADGRPSFRLEALAPANGIAHGNAHDALADVLATLDVARLVRERAPDLWTHFLKFSRKSAVRNFIAREEAFLCLGQAGEPRAVAPIGPSSRSPNVFHCVDLAYDPRELAVLSSDRLIELTGPRGIIRRLKTNRAPLLLPLRDAPAHLLSGSDADALIKKAHALRKLPNLLRKVADCADAHEKIYPPSALVEEQLYENGFWSDRDAALLAEFHVLPWEARPSLLRQLEDTRLRQLGWRILFLERPDLLVDEARGVAAKAMALRLLGLKGRIQPWLSVPGALLALEDHDFGDDQHSDAVLESYRARLAGWLIHCAAVLDDAKSIRRDDQAAISIERLPCREDRHGR